jgi:hypothetical protein
MESFNFLSRAYCLGLLALMLLAGCGSGNDNFVATATGSGGATPPGVIINPGTGPVNSEQDAIDRFFRQYLGVEPVSARAQVFGTDQAPLVNAYILPGGPFSAGANVTDADDPLLGFVLDQPYYLFWVDPNPVANLGHNCSIVYLRAGDGLLVEQDVDFDPLVGNQRLLELPSDLEAGLIYTHAVWRDLGYAPGEPSVAAQSDILAQGLGQPGGPSIGGLGVAGATEERRTADLAAGAALFTDMGGELVDFDTLRDKEGDRKDGFDLEEALAKASEGLGPDDKFLFVLSSHGSPHGTFSMGTDSLTWAQLCELLEQNVTAGNVNLVLDTCFSGLAVAEFEKWNTKKRVKIVTSTGVATPSYSRSNGLGINLGCVIKDLRMRLDAAGDELTLGELEQAMEDVNVTQEELDKKICEAIGDVPGANLSPKKRAWKDDYLGVPGAADKVTRTTPPKKGGFDKRPITEEVTGFLDDWRKAINSHPDFGFVIPFPQLDAFYPLNFIFDGQNVSQINRLGNNVRHQLSPPIVSHLDVDPQTGDITIRFTIRDDITVSGGNPISQSEESETRMVLHPVTPPVTGEPRFDIFSQIQLHQTAQGTIGSGPPVSPLLPIIGDYSFSVLAGPLPDGGVDLGILEQVTGEATVLDLQPSGSGSSSVVGSTLGGQVTYWSVTSGDIFEGIFNVPTVPTGPYVLTVFAENRNIGPGGESFSAVSRAVEVNIVP